MLCCFTWGFGLRNKLHYAQQLQTEISGAFWKEKLLPVSNCPPQLVGSPFDHNNPPPISWQKGVSKSGPIPLHNNGSLQGLSSISPSCPQKTDFHTHPMRSYCSHQREIQGAHTSGGVTEAGKNLCPSLNPNHCKRLRRASPPGARGKKSKVTRNRAALPRSSPTTPAPPAPRDLPPTASRR